MAVHKQAPAVVYPYKYTNTAELEWSVKSLKNITHSKIYVVGDPHPGFEVILPLVNPWSRQSRYHDTVNKYYTACLVATEDELLLMNDDFFIMFPWTPQNYNRGTLEQHMQERNGKDDYQRRLQWTNNHLLSKGLTALSYELHAPMLVNRLLLKEAIEEILPLLRTRRGILLRSYYGNRFNIQSEYMQDCKNPVDYKDKVLLSTNNRSFVSEMGEYIRSKICE